jgi:hypothetical protein
VVLIICAILFAAWWFRDALQTPEQVHQQVLDAQAARYRDGKPPLVLAFNVEGEVSHVDAATATITLWGTTWPVEMPKNTDPERTEGWAQTKATLVVRSVYPASTAVGRKAQSQAYFVERRAVAGRTGQPPVYEWIYDTDERAALKRLRQAAADGR